LKSQMDSVVINVVMLFILHLVGERLSRSQGPPEESPLQAAVELMFEPPPRLEGTPYALV